MQSPLSICPSVCFHSVFGTDWLLTLTFCLPVGHDHSSQGLEVMVQTNAVGSTLIEGSFCLVCTLCHKEVSPLCLALSFININWFRYFWQNVTEKMSNPKMLPYLTSFLHYVVKRETRNYLNQLKYGTIITRESSDACWDIVFAILW